MEVDALAMLIREDNWHYHKILRPYEIRCSYETPFCVIYYSLDPVTEAVMELCTKFRLVSISWSPIEKSFGINVIGGQRIPVSHGGDLDL